MGTFPACAVLPLDEEEPLDIQLMPIDMRPQPDMNDDAFLLKGTLSGAQGHMHESH